MKIFYIHHAIRAKANPPTQEDGITRLGRKDAKICAKMFKKLQEKFNICAIVTSPFYRCLETARIINKQLKVDLFLDERLNELNGLLPKKDKDIKLASKEPWIHCQRRITDAIKDIVEKYDNGEPNTTVLVVTSGVNLTAFINIAYGLSASNERPYPIVIGCSPICFDITKEMIKKIQP